MIKRGSVESNGNLAFAIVKKGLQKGLLMFAPVELGAATEKICPPLIISREALEEGLLAVREAIAEAARYIRACDAA